MSENSMITNRTAVSQIHDVKTSVAQSLDNKESYEEIVTSLFPYLNQMGGGAIILVADNTNKSTEAITRVKDRRNNNKRCSIRPIVNRAMKEAKALMITTGGGNGGEKKGGDSRINWSSDCRVSVICVPLVSKKETRGVHSTNVPQGFRKDDLLFINNLGNRAALAIENILLHEKNRRSEEALEKGGHPDQCVSRQE